MTTMSLAPLRIIPALFAIPALLWSCGGSSAPPEIETTSFAASLGVDLSQSTKLPSGEYVRDLTLGTGDSVAAGLTIAVHYTGYFTNGEIFDSNVAPAAPFSFDYGYGEVILGWDHGLDGVKVGGTRQLIIPPSQAYGAGGNSVIPGNSILVFTVTVVGVYPLPTIETATFAPALNVDLSQSTKLTNGEYIRDTTLGSGTAITSGSTVAVHYSGYLADDTLFDSNVAPAATFNFTYGAGQVIPGWDQGLSGVMPGGTRQLIIPPGLAYGSAGQGAIPPNSILVFTVTVVSVH
jgi:FKBP-type peptidyl-prolyl cis-trans isomerase